jgi:hypothetical protein
MTKQKKKRTKSYTGKDAAVTRPTITRIQAANRNKFSQYWFERKKILKPIIITILVIIALVILAIEIVRIVNGG